MERWTLNRWFMAGLLVSLIPILLSWVEIGEGCVFERHISAIEVLERPHELREVFPYPVLVSATLFLAGTLIALITPLGSLAQAAGILVLAVLGWGKWVPQFEGGVISYCPRQIQVGFGIIAGALSAGLILTGMLRGVRFDGSLRRFEGHPKLWTFSRRKSG